jgi:hypothetical protein
MVHEMLPNKKIENIMQCPSKNSPPLWYGSDFFSKMKILLCIDS